MEGRIFYEQRSISVLVIGDMIHHHGFIEDAKKVCKFLYLASNHEMLQAIVEKHRIDLIFGTLSYEEDAYLTTLETIRKKDNKIDMVLFFYEMCKLPFEERVVALKCKRYFCMKAEEKYIMKLFTESVDSISRENMLRKDTQYFDALLESSVVSQSDTQGNITYINDNFTKITGYTKEEVIGKNHRILKHRSNSQDIFENMWKTITKGNVWRERVLNRNKDGSDFWADTIIIPFRDDKTNEIIQYIAIRRDITQMLEEKRTVYEKELKAQEQMKLSEAKDSFLILFTHELKTPLNAIINFSQYLYKNMHRIDEIPKVKRMHLLEQIYKSAASMLENVTNILDLSRLRNHKLNYTYTLFDLNATILEVIERHQPLAFELRKTIHYQSDGSEPYITSDEYRLKQILANVVSNALKYGSSKVNIFLLSDNEKIEIIIEDDGKGIVDKEAVFELYEQDAKGVTSMEKKGTGIGLNFVKLLCEDLRFSYRLEDARSLSGTRFVLTKMRRE